MKKLKNVNSKLKQTYSIKIVFIFLLKYIIYY